MQQARPNFILTNAILLALPCLAASAVSYASDTYNPATKQLTIPQLQFGNATFWDMVITPGKVYGIAGGEPTSTFDAYTYTIPYGFELHAPSVQVGGTTYTNVSASIASMATVASVTGADRYDGTYLYIPSVLVGTHYFSYGIISVSRIDGLVGGFPTGSGDRYDTSTGQLSIPAVEVNGKAYTNVTVNVGHIYSVNGSGSAPGSMNSSTCYNANNYATGTTMDLFYGDAAGNPDYEVQSVVIAPSTFNGVANAVGIKNTTITSQGTSVATEYYDITSHFPVLLELGINTGASNETFTPGDQFFGALGYGQSLTTSGTLASAGGSSSFTTTYTFMGLEDVTVPAGTFHAACKWSDTSSFGQGSGTVFTWTSHQGVLLRVGTASEVPTGSTELQAGSTYNGAPVGQ